MSIDPLSLRKDYWETLKISETDLEFLYNHLLEVETPLTPAELTFELINERIHIEKNVLLSQQSSRGQTYIPKNQYNLGQKVAFPLRDWQVGTVTNVRPGHNPELQPFQVIEVEFPGDVKREFASELLDHALNNPIEVKLDDPLLNSDFIFNTFGAIISEQLTEKLEDNSDLVRIAGRWFPRALLVDVNEGHLNLAEAVLDMAGGGPLSTRVLLEQIELPTDVNAKLTEFSLNLAMQEDGRFDEVGPAGEVIWFLRRLEPDQVQSIPHHLRYSQINYDRENVLPMLNLFETQVEDELEQTSNSVTGLEQLSICLIYPHWRTGTLPLSHRVSKLFPTAYESPRVQFFFIDGETGKAFPGWVVRASKYVYGLKDWYDSHSLLPGSLVQIKRGKNPGEVIISVDKKRPSREWIRTALVGSDGGIVFAMLKQMVNSPFDDRMAIMISDVALLEKNWEPSNRSNRNLEQVVINMMRELAKLNPQGHVHAQELYAAVNLVRRCPPGPILNLLAEKSWVSHLGDLYFRLEENSDEDNQ